MARGPRRAPATTRGGLCHELGLRKAQTRDNDSAFPGRRLEIERRFGAGGSKARRDFSLKNRAHFRIVKFEGELKFETVGSRFMFAASSAESRVTSGDTSRARFVSSSRAMILLMLQGACLCSDREPSSPEASAGLSLPCHGRETPVSTECASSRRAAARRAHTVLGEFIQAFPCFFSMPAALA